MSINFPNGITITDEQIPLLRMEFSKQFTRQFNANPLFQKAIQVVPVSGMYDVFHAVGAVPYSKGALKKGDSVTTNDANIWQLPVTLSEYAEGVDMLRKTMRSLRSIDNIIEQIPPMLISAFFARLDAAVAEFVSSSIGTLGALDADETKNETWDGDTLISNVAGHLGGTLDNQIAGTGTTQAQIQTDVYAAIMNNIRGIMYGTDYNRFWGAQDIQKLQVIIYYPTSMAENMEKAITATYRAAFLSTATSNATEDNILAKMGIQLVNSPNLDTIDVDDYYIFITTESHPSPQALSLAINTKTEFDVMELGLPQINIGIDSAEKALTNMLRIEFPDPNGSDRYRIDRVWTPVQSSDFTIVGSNPYRICKVVN